MKLIVSSSLYLKLKAFVFNFYYRNDISDDNL